LGAEALAKVAGKPLVERVHLAEILIAISLLLHDLVMEVVLAEDFLLEDLAAALAQEGHLLAADLVANADQRATTLTSLASSIAPQK
jgi:hypothetical protein